MDLHLKNELQELEEKIRILNKKIMEYELLRDSFRVSSRQRKAEQERYFHEKRKDEILVELEKYKND